MHLFYVNFYKKFCTPDIKIEPTLIEQISRLLSVHPGSITVPKYGLVWKDNTFGQYEKLGEKFDQTPECYVTFYTPRGAQDCKVQFNERGWVDFACDTGNPNSFTRKLGFEINGLYLKHRRRLPEPPPPSMGRRFDLGTGLPIEPRR